MVSLQAFLRLLNPISNGHCDLWSVGLLAASSGLTLELCIAALSELSEALELGCLTMFAYTIGCACRWLQHTGSRLHLLPRQRYCISGLQHNCCHCRSYPSSCACGPYGPADANVEVTGHQLPGTTAGCWRPSGSEAIWQRGHLATRPFGPGDADITFTSDKSTGMRARCWRLLTKKVIACAIVLGLNIYPQLRADHHRVIPRPPIYY